MHKKLILSAILTSLLGFSAMAQQNGWGNGNNGHPGNNGGGYNNGGNNGNGWGGGNNNGGWGNGNGNGWGNNNGNGNGNGWGNNGNGNGDDWGNNNGNNGGSYGWLQAQCETNGRQERVVLRWQRPNYNMAYFVNALQKGDMYPYDPNRFWDFVPNDHQRFDFIDYNVRRYDTYSYRIKYTPNIVSNTAQVRITPRECRRVN
jgi:hypothetical protein